MKAAQALQAVRKRVRVGRDQRVEIGELPFQPGTEVEVIVVGQREEAARFSARTGSPIRHAGAGACGPGHHLWLSVRRSY